MEWSEDDSTDSFTDDCEACGAPVLVTSDMRTPERYIYDVTCPACDDHCYLVSIPAIAADGAEA